MMGSGEMVFATTPRALSFGRMERRLESALVLVSVE